MQKNFNIWQGIYANFNAIPKSDDIFVDPIWQNNSINKLEKCYTNIKSDKTITDDASVHEYVLSPMLAILQCLKSELNILDFGGGIGEQYIDLLAKLPQSHKINYHIVENPITIGHGKKILQSHSNIFFHQNIPTEINFDLIHLGSSLQYVSDWQGLLKQLFSLKAQFFLFSDLMAGEIPTFASTQYFYGKKIATWFWNLKEFIKFVQSNNYKLIFKSYYIGTFLGKKSTLPMKNFPKTHQLPHATHLAFSRNV